jgi:hypothetical protein
MCVDLCGRENKSEPARRKFTFPIEAYADRIRLKARLELASSEPAMIMFDILAKKRVPLVKATNAVRETLDSATNTGYATQRLENLDMLRKQRLVLLDELISKFSAFVDAISKLPPNSKAILNKRMAGITKNGVFDTEVINELVDSVAECLPQLSPKKLAEEAFLLLLAETPCGGAVTRFKAVGGYSFDHAKSRRAGDRGKSSTKWHGSIANNPNVTQ